MKNKDEVNARQRVAAGQQPRAPGSEVAKVLADLRGGVWIKRLTPKDGGRTSWPRGSFVFHCMYSPFHLCTVFIL